MKKITIKEGDSLLKEFNVNEIFNGSLYIRIPLSKEDYDFFNSFQYNVTKEDVVTVTNGNLSNHETNKLMYENQKYCFLISKSSLTENFFNYILTDGYFKDIPELWKEDKIDKHRLKESNNKRLSVFIDDELLK